MHSDRLLQILVIEDRVEDEEHLSFHLTRAGYRFRMQRVETKPDLILAMNQYWDIVIGDYSLPGFTGLEALEIVRSLNADVPFLIVSDTIGEEIVIEAMQAGAADFIMKNKLLRLVPALEREITDFQHRLARKKAELDLLASEERYRMITENMLDIVSLHDLEGNYKYISPSFGQIFGLEADDYIGHSVFSIVHPEDQSMIKGLLDSFTESIVSERKLEARFRRSDGSYIWLETLIKPIIDERGRLREFQSVSRDITERKENEEIVRKSLKEKEILLREIHHRVKNNLQVISSLLQLQAESVEDAKFQKLFTESQHRLRSMALIHEMLYQSEDISGINFAEYVDSLCGYLMMSYDSKERIKLELNIEPVELNIDTAIPCGLILAELLTNSLKHAFPENNSGIITITFATTEQGYELCFTDDGVGLPENIDIWNMSSMGLQVVKTLVKQLKGSVKLDRESGTRYDLQIQELNYNDRE